MILVTGGTGFLGAYVIQNLVEKGHAVRAIKRKSNPPFYLPSSIADKVQWVDGDVLDVVSLEDAMQDVESIIHSAAIVSFSATDRKRMYAVNIEGTANVVNMALDCGVKRLLHVSSVAALGRTVKGGIVNERKKWEESRNNTHYALTKHHAEMHVWRGFAEGLNGVIVNPGTVLGFGDWHQSSAAIFRNAYREFPWFTKGVNGFVGVKDAAEAIVRLHISEINHKRFIINSENWSFGEVFNAIADGFGKRRPHREATPFLGALAWRIEALRAALSGKKPLLTRETARIAQSRTQFDNSAILKALPGFSFTPLADVIREADEKYLSALQSGLITL